MNNSQTTQDYIVEIDAREILGVDADTDRAGLERARAAALESCQHLDAEATWINRAIQTAFDQLTSGQRGRVSLRQPGIYLQNETTYFVLANVLDIFLTYMLLALGAIEANPIAAYFYDQWGFNGMIAFKLVLTAGICVITQVIARRRLAYARNVLWIGIIVVGLVVIYSLRLLAGQL